ncbi:MAG: dihydrolipoyllysine-residue acetyltransferase [Gammaproteobacteria bacterium]
MAATVVVVPDIGDFEDIPVIEILVSPGERVEAEQSLITLESDKATMDVPAPHAGVIGEIKVALGDTVSEGTVIMELEAAAGGNGQSAPGAGEQAAPAPVATVTEPEPESLTASTAAQTDTAPVPGESPALMAGASAPDPRAPRGRPSPTQTLRVPPADADATTSHATPAIRRFARTLGVDLAGVTGTGRKGRILRQDVERHVKERLAHPGLVAGAAGVAGGGPGIPPIPEVDFAKFGPVQTQPLSRIKRISGPFLHRSWLNVPHVTHHDEADITELEAFRKSLKDDPAAKGVRVTPLAFFMKALCATLREFPGFNASLSPDGQELILKQYFHIGVAVDTPNGLVVPVVRDVDTKGIVAIAEELAEISMRAREGKLRPEEMQGGCMSISSLGGIGGTAFTPIVNAPEIAILGIARSRMTPVWNGTEFVPRLMLPLDLSYDHRVVDGAESARFVSFLCGQLSDVRKLLL